MHCVFWKLSIRTSDLCCSSSSVGSDDPITGVVLRYTISGTTIGQRLCFLILFLTHMLTFFFFFCILPNEWSCRENLLWLIRGHRFPVFSQQENKWTYFPKCWIIPSSASEHAKRSWPWKWITFISSFDLCSSQYHLPPKSRFDIPTNHLPAPCWLVASGAASGLASSLTSSRSHLSVTTSIYLSQPVIHPLSTFSSSTSACQPVLRLFFSLFPPRISLA